ncbi:unnamed protein product [Parascedosporium putredinis]|uniref:Major facilitator superfamily (MFS) profile domain-containing protein n=1 Tax=Parascedosporium putredinis TaxID=1442378 RepID=A0A9P1GXT0_9PEZI|nr:unnamed protein product [Parascedosporium putredinis]CAI7990122.1 unnamed protein product [Parascedosporium putredinis]
MADQSEKNEKTLERSADGELSGSDGAEIDFVEWTEDEENRLVRKLDFLLMPLLVLGFFALQLDRGNIGNALTDNFFKDVGITQNQFNVGQQLLSLGIILLEIPSNLILYRIGPTIWIGGQIIAWGLVATCQAFQKGLPAYMVTRLLLGLCEAGFIPACLFTMTRWYKSNETSKRFSWFFIGNTVASAMTGIIAYGILHMRGVAGLAGWQWLFILEGIFTILVGFAFLAVFPESASHPVSLLKLRYFSERESRILHQRVLKDDPTKAQASRNVKWAEIKGALTNWRLIPHIGFTIVGLAPASAFGSYAPTLVAGFGFEKLRSNALSSIANRALVHSTDANLRYAILTISIAVSWPWHAVNGSWLALNAKSAGERSVTLAIHIMSANCAGIVGKQLFRSEDSPLYVNGFTIIVGLTSAAVVLSGLANLQYFLLNGRKFARSGLQYTY